jgi:hypothetical protein
MFKRMTAAVFLLAFLAFPTAASATWSMRGAHSMVRRQTVLRERGKSGAVMH